MLRVYTLTRYRGFTITAVPSAVAGTVFLWLLLLVVGVLWLELPVGSAVGDSLLTVVLHWFSVLFHHWGHQLAAKSAGFPMVGLRLWFLLATSIYPPDEPPLPKAIHVRRAVAGPLASGILGMIAAAISYSMRDTGGVLWYVITFMAFENIMILSLGALFPLGFNDGSTLLALRGKPDPTRL